MNLSIVIPAYNESDRIEQTLKSLKNLQLRNSEIIVVDDGSIDETKRIASQYADKLVVLNRNEGKGQALQKGWKEAEGDYIACLDADLGESSVEVRRLLAPVLNKQVDLTISMISPGKKAGMGIVKRRVQSLVYQKTGKHLQAPLSGQRVFHRKWLPFLIERKYVGFGIEAQMTIDLLNAGATFLEVPTTMTHREMGKSIRGFYHRLKQWIEIEKQLRGAGS
ncbi:glycosyltransferase family 2 protein [Bacillus suaedae]|uniref:Glucosyl-3-phosphoglycerate synthase n=1 Tax=Halalkalibacter suaedae TaxID=2822140 RepID=A0A940X042_9BACI|nr:glycosyltransferase family 2 protein [Bacillus suaedae]MBP3952290.1 glycosyltransferase family 2 protein [Bacillus suaedae]